MKALVTESIATFFLVLVYGLTVNLDAALAALAIGMTVMVMVYAGPVRVGAHGNPAVTLAHVVTGSLPRGRLPLYWGAQFAGSILAGLLVWKMTGVPTEVQPEESASVSKVMIGEIVATFALVYVWLRVDSGKAREGNSYYGLAVGATLAAVVVAIGPITGGAFNPALGFGSAITQAMIGLAFPTHAWVYLAGPFGGAIAAALVAKYLDS